MSTSPSLAVPPTEPVYSEAEWQRNIQSEFQYWQGFLENEASDTVKYRLSSVAHKLGGTMARLAEGVAGKLVEIIDVGCGPTNTVGTQFPDKTVRVLRVDPLGNEYNKLLIGLGYSAKANILTLQAERLADSLPHNHFHLCHAQNALDHSWNPLLCIRNIIKVIRPGGRIYIRHFINVGEIEKYDGLHQWNFQPLPDEKDCLLWRPDYSVKLKTELAGLVEIDEVVVEQDAIGFFMILTKL